MKPIPVIIDSDIGDDITDTTAIIFALKSPELEIKALLSNNNHEKERARILHKLVRLSGKQIPVFQGVEGGTGALRRQGEFVKDYRPEIEKLSDNIDYVEELLKNGAVYVSDGTLTNPAYLLKKIPHRINRAEFHVMAGAIYRNYRGGKAPVSEWNIDCDINSAQKFFSSEANINLYPLDCSWNLTITDRQINQITSIDQPLNQALKQQFSFWRDAHDRNLIEYDSLLMAALIRPQLITKWKKLRLKVNLQGRTVPHPDGKQIKTALETNKNKFTQFFLERMQI